MFVLRCVGWAHAKRLRRRPRQAAVRQPDVGVDPDADWIAQARDRADRRLSGRNVRFVIATADDAGLEPGAWDAALNVAASHAHGGYAGALQTLAELVRPGGVALLGEGVWQRAPSEAFLAALGGATADELPTFEGLIEEAERAGLTWL